MQQRKDLRDGQPITVVLPGGPTVKVGPSQIAHALAQYQAGQPVFVLAETVGGGPMTEITMT